ncbi:hypothetical protein RHMOL_Rhmol12G0165100 [Rhododendron molle]|uniref:Uncharacterized protein n=1 Tax=Rhododendron molle TaxID=49168 RepID=A0ACC0LJB4_RHOML|nr:hypothetical protein RHMOL_Rhmol12G0165100 [Rhododendron molle]
MEAAAVISNPEQLDSCAQPISFDNPPSAVTGVRETQDRFKSDREGDTRKRSMSAEKRRLIRRSPPINN